MLLFGGGIGAVQVLVAEVKPVGEFLFVQVEIKITDLLLGKKRVPGKEQASYNQAVDFFADAFRIMPITDDFILMKLADQEQKYVIFNFYKTMGIRVEISFLNQAPDNRFLIIVKIVQGNIFIHQKFVKIIVLIFEGCYVIQPALVRKKMVFKPIDYITIRIDIFALY